MSSERGWLGRDKEKGPLGPSLEFRKRNPMRGSVSPAGMQDLNDFRQLVRILTRSRTVLESSKSSGTGFRHHCHDTPDGAVPN